MNISEYGLLYLIVWPLVGAIITQILLVKNSKLRNDWVDIVVFCEAVVTIFLGINVLRGNSLELSVKDIFGAGLYLKMDSFRAMFTVLVAVLWLMATLVCKDYFKEKQGEGKFQFFSLITLGATMGFVLSNNFFCGFVFFEILSLASYPLVAVDKTDDDMKAAASYLTIGIIGGLVTLVGILLLHYNVSTLNYDSIRNYISSNSFSDKVFIPGIFIAFGFAAKAGMFPVHTWLCKTYNAAPAPGTALLSSVLSKMGVLGIIIVSCKILFGYGKWGVLLLVLGTITMLLGAILALNQANMKKIIAYSSMSQIGFICVGLGTGVLLKNENALAMGGSFMHMINHSVFKMVLFTIVAIIVINAGRDLSLDKIRGIGRKDWILKIVFIISGLGLAGFPGTSGYISKTLIHESIVEYGHIAKEGQAVLSQGQVKLFEIFFLIAGGCTLAYIIKIFVAVFIEKGNYEGEAYSNNWLIKSVSKTTVGILVVLTAAVILVGILPNILADYAIDKSMVFMSTSTMEHEFSYFALENLKGVSISFIIGVAVYIWIKNQKRTYFIPECIDMEKYLYKPILFTILPTIGTFFSRIIDWVVDAPVYWLRRTVLKDNKIIKEVKPKSKRFENARDLSTILSKSVSFGLMMFGIGFFVTIVYLLVLFFSK